MGDLVFAEIIFNLRTGDGEQRADNLPAPGGDAAEPGCPAAAGKVEEQGLGVVVQIVGGEDIFRADLVGAVSQKGVAQLPRRLLQTHAVGERVAGGVAVPGQAGDAVLPAPGFHKAQIAQGFLPADAMLEVGGGHVQPCRK